MLRSLRARLLLWVLAPITLTVGVGTWFTYENAVQMASANQDLLLLGSARGIAEHIRFEDGSFENHIPPSALELFHTGGVDRIYYRVTAGTGRLLSGYTDLPLPDPVPDAGGPFYFDAVMRGAPVRIVVLLQPVVGAPTARPALVQVAQTMNAHGQTVRRLWLGELRQQLLLLALTALLLVLSVQRGLRPLLHLVERVRARQPATLERLERRRVPHELQPLVDALNDYVARLEAHMQAQAVFLQDAAHQLRTPFAVLQTQLGYAARADGETERLASLNAARTTVRHASRLVQQLLTLSAAEAPLAREGDAEIAPLVQEVFEALSARAEAKHMILAFEPDGTVPSLPVNPLPLREMLLNLVDNAVRYTPEGGTVLVRVQREPDGITLSVEDTGPGIPVEQREAVFGRFVRLDNRDSEGSGLGLAIVRQLALQIGATVSLHDGPDGRGLLVRVRLP